MNENELRTELYNKLLNEFNEYKEILKTLPSEKIIQSSYEYVMKEELYLMFNPDLEKFDINQIKALNKTDKPLEELYQGWMDSDVGINSVLEDNVYDTLDDLNKLQIEKNSKNKVKER